MRSSLFKSTIARQGSCASTVWSALPSIGNLSRSTPITDSRVFALMMDWSSLAGPPSVAVALSIVASSGCSPSRASTLRGVLDPSRWIRARMSLLGGRSPDCSETPDPVINTACPAATAETSASGGSGSQGARGSCDRVGRAATPAPASAAPRSGVRRHLAPKPRRRRTPAHRVWWRRLGEFEPATPRAPPGAPQAQRLRARSVSAAATAPTSPSA